MQFELKNVSKIYETGQENITYGAKDVTLTIKEGDFTALVGPSGSGKTTLLNLIAGLLIPTKGEILHKGESITHMSLEERTTHRLDYMGFVFQEYQLLPVLTAYENVDITLQLKKLHNKEIKVKASCSL